MTDLDAYCRTLRTIARARSRAKVIDRDAMMAAWLGSLTQEELKGLRAEEEGKP